LERIEQLRDRLRLISHRLKGSLQVKGSHYQVQSFGL
jgi:hypothetical protein